jgi:DNA-binding GntR family transcriptional regulator
VNVLRALSLSVKGRPAESLAELRAIVEAVDANDADATAAACSRHVEAAGRVVLRALTDQGAAEDEPPARTRRARKGASA